MKILKKRIRTLENYLIGLNDNEPFYISNIDLTRIDKIKNAGFISDLNVGDQILPAVIGKISNFNANGGYSLNRSMPKETLFREAVIKDWHGYKHTVQIPYKRYPRIPIEAPNIEIVVVENSQNQKIIRSPEFIKGKTSSNIIIHTINLFLELFGECDTLKTNLIPVFNLPITRLNWNLLPPGKYPWNVLKTKVQECIANVSSSIKHLIENRLEILANHNPNFVAIGIAGFKGYIVFGFPNKNFYILESTFNGNATYVFGSNWKELSQLSKGEILSQNLQINRIIHNDSWESMIQNLF